MNWLGEGFVRVGLAEGFEVGFLFLEDCEDGLVAGCFGVDPGQRELLEVRSDERDDDVEDGVFVSVGLVDELVVVGSDLHDVAVDSRQPSVPSLWPCCSTRCEATLFQM